MTFVAIGTLRVNHYFLKNKALLRDPVKILKKDNFIKFTFNIIGATSSSYTSNTGNPITSLSTLFI